MRLPLLLLSGLLCGPVYGDSWPAVRGSHQDGHSAEAGLIDGWPEAGPPVLWTRELGQGYSAFSGAGDRVYTQYQTLGGQYVICLNADTGETVWDYWYGLPYEPAGLYPGPRATPTLAEGRLYVSTPDGRLICLQADSGKRLWQLNLFERFQAELVDFGYSCSPTVIDDQVLMPVGGKDAALVALRASDGEILWHAGSLPVSHTPALPIERARRKLVVAYLQNSLALFDRETGQQLTVMSLSSGYDEHAAWPIYRDPYLWISAPFRAGCELLEITDADPPEFKPVWRSKLMSNDVCSSVLVDGFLYGFDIQDVQSKTHRPSRGTFRCLEFATGEERWSNGTPNERRLLEDDGPRQLTDSFGHASVITADGKLILFNDTGELLLVEATPEACRPLARTRVLGGSIVWTSPSLIDRRLLLRNHSRAVCLYLGEPQELQTSARPALSVADIPQETYRDWAAVILPVEPEYAMDAPTPDWLLNWFVVSLALGWALTPLPASLALLFPAGRSWSRFRSAQRSLTFLAGAAGTTILSGWRQDFLFTWPLALYALLEAVVWQLRSRDGGAPSHPARARLVLLAFVLGVVAYYVLCLRLSLAFEWAFLLGFPAAMPCLLLARRIARRPRWWAYLLEYLLSVLGFVAFYGTGTAVLLWKY